MPASRPSLAGELADLDTLVSAPDIVTVAERTTRAIGDAAATFFAAEANFRLDRIIAAARSVPANDNFERLAIDRAVDQIAGRGKKTGRGYAGNRPIRPAGRRDLARGSS